ncbi:glycosyl hydrolase family 28-related protein [Dyella silvatica]|uniref:glycosyl hydrolase family 28-related protein n=1 Tax=Dyella silvatica TaxID=2992128 RepID=UPI0022595E52|nr:glycosyl hydrolase family 28-related protein [Dyella silvatica]
MSNDSEMNALSVKAAVSLTDTPVLHAELAAGGGSALVGYMQGGAGAVARTVQDKLRDVVSVKDFGAVGNGQADDTSAINAADSAATALGATLFFPTGIYCVNNSGVMQHGCSWVGAGSASSVIKALPQSFTNNTGMVNAVGLSNFRISNLGFDISAGIFPAGIGNPGNIYWVYQAFKCTNWILDHCAFTGIQAHTIGLAVDGGSYFNIEDNYFYMPVPTSAYNQAINISVAAGSVGSHFITRNTMIGTGLFSNGGLGCIDGNYVAGYAFGAGLAFGPLANCTQNRITNNVCTGGIGEDVNNTYPSGIECWSAYSIITGNMCSANSGNGITVGDLNTVVSNNICFNNGQSAGALGAGIKMFSIPGYNASDCVVNGNICFDNQSSKTQSYGYVEAVVGGDGIMGNTIVDNNFNNNMVGTMLANGGKMTFRGPQLFVATGANPGTMLAGASLAAVYSIGGAEFGDTVKVSFASDNQGISIFGYVNAINSVTVLFVNNTGGNKVFTENVLNIWIEKPVGYAGVG